MRSAELAIIISYATSASGKILFCHIQCSDVLDSFGCMEFVTWLARRWHALTCGTHVICSLRSWWVVGRWRKLGEQAVKPRGEWGKGNLKFSRVLHRSRWLHRQNVTFALLVLLRDFSNLFNLYNVAELSSNRAGGNGI